LLSPDVWEINMPASYDRDLIGYGENPPDPKWPGGARLAVNFVMNYEEGSEPSVQDGEGFTETGLTEAHGLSQGVKGRDLAGEGMFEYGSRVGFWRLMRLFQERKLPMTVFGCALALERHKPASDAIRSSGFDVCCHGWRWIKHFELTEAEEREHIARAVASLEATVGERPLGWYCRYGPGVNTRRLIVEEGGFLYDRDALNDELPYWVTVDGTPHLVIPYSYETNDNRFDGNLGFGTSHDFFTYMKDAFDVLYAEAATEPKMMSLGLHDRLIGRPARARGLADFLDYVLRHDGVWICRGIDIAQHWRQHHPAPPTAAPPRGKRAT